MIKSGVLTGLTIVLFYLSIFKIPRVFTDRNDVPLHSPRFKKLVYFVIDGLRFDAFVPSNKEGLYYNNFTFTKDPAIVERTFFSVTSIPTATTCRIIGLMTGAPSNLIEELFTFIMTKVRVESLPDKFADRSMWVYGDNIWDKSFKILSDKSFTHCGLSKTDLVNNEILVYNKAREDSHIDVRFIHTIAVDAFGHVYGDVNVEKIKEAQIRADDFLNDIYRDMDDDTLLVVTSDHGVKNDGAHGGSSKHEMASFCGFYSKKPLEIKTRPEDFVYNVPFIEKFYDSRHFNSADDWIQAKTPYRVIHQDDILPTVCYLMGVSTPINTYGSLVPHIVDDPHSQKILFDQKSKQLARLLKSDSLMSAGANGYEEANYLVTQQIYSKCTGKYPLLAAAALAFGLIAFCRVFTRSLKAAGIWSYIPSTIPFIAVTIMVTHSYWSFASEDIAWAGAFLLTNFTPSNLAFIIFFLKTAGRYMFAEDKINLHIPHFSGTAEIWLWVAIFFILKNISTTRARLHPNYRFLGNCFALLPQFCYILMSQLCPLDYQSRITFLSVYHSLDSLIAVHFSPPIALLIIYFLKNIQYSRTQATKHLLLAFCPSLLNLEKVQQSLNYNVFFALTSDLHLHTCIIAAFSYLIIPRLYIIRNFPVNSQGHTLNIFSLFLCFVCSWVMCDTLVFQYFFVGRLLMVSLFFLTDVMIEAYVVAKRMHFKPLGMKSLREMILWLKSI